MRELHFLVTNDDGVESPLLAALVAALLARGRVTVVAPHQQRSWISKAHSRHQNVVARERAGLFGCPAWETDGTPADCVNLALGQLVRERIDMVVSGINMGTNAALPLILASGTVGGALEASLHGMHAMATSLRLMPADFVLVREPGAKLPVHLKDAANAAASRSAELAAELARQPRPKKFLVHNLNFPPDATPATPLERTMPAPLRSGCLFAPVPDHPGVFTFAFGVGEELPSTLLTDRACLESGRATYSVLDFGRLGVATGPFGDVGPAAANG